MRGLSLFSGIGGLDLPFEAAGGSVVAMCESDQFCRSVLQKHWPDIPVYDDVKTLGGEQIGAVDIIYGGFPCQPYSVCGQRKAKGDHRHLWPECARLVGEIKPAWCVFENVPGILTLAADDICADLERQGYAVGIFCYEAAALGAPHRRMRVFFVAHTEIRRREPRENQSKRNFKQIGETPHHQAPGSGGSPGAVPNPGRRMRERCSVKKTFYGEYGASPSADPERSGGTSHAEESVPDADMQRLEKQLPAFSAHGKRAALELVERGRRRLAEPPLGGVADGFPSELDRNLAWLDTDWWMNEPDIPRVVQKGVPHRTQRLKALGNAVVPAQIYPIFAAIAEINRYDWRDEK
jgi:DNA (cytosine-5)-methyltransferase 1